jgi:acetylglutamate kinase
LGFVGEVVDVNLEPILAAVAAESIPVISPLAKDSKGGYTTLMPTSPRYARGKLKAEKFVYLSDVPGIMRDATNRESLIPSVSAPRSSNSGRTRL